MGEMLSGPLPSNAQGQDANGNGTLERDEAGGAYAINFDSIDTNQDGSLSGVEVNVDTHPLDIVYNEHMTITLGGRTVELMHSYPSHSEDMTTLLFPQERAAFAVDFMHVKRFPGNFASGSIDNYKIALEELDALNFDILIQGHGQPGNKSDLTSYITFIQTMETEVAAAIEEGKSLEETQASVLLSDFSDWSLYEQRRANIVGQMFSLLSRD